MIHRDLLHTINDMQQVFIRYMLCFSGYYHEGPHTVATEVVWIVAVYRDSDKGPILADPYESALSGTIS